MAQKPTYEALEARIQALENIEAEYKAFREALAREHTMLARTEAVAHVGSWEWEAETDTTIWSEELFRIFGLEPRKEAPSFTEHQAWYVPEDRVRLLAAVETCLQDSVPYDLELRVTRPDGHLRHCVVRGLPEHGPDGSVKRLYGSLHDITEIRRAEERIAILSHMLDEAPASITIHDTDGRFVFANAKSVALHGYDSLDEFMTVNLHDLDVPASEAMLAERFRQIHENGEARFEVAHFREDGTTFPLEVLARQIQWEGRPAILSIATDITERKKSEDHLQKFKQIVSSTTDGISLLDADYRYIIVNKAYAAYSGKKKEELIGLTVQEYLGAEVFEGIQWQLDRCLAGETITYQDWFEYPSMGKRFIEVTYFPFTSDTGEVLGIAVNTRDITEQKQAEAERERLQEQLNQAQKMESVGRLAGGVAHDFNNMLGVILGRAELALARADESHDLYADLKEIQKAAQRSADITKQLLAFARKQTISPRKLDLNDTLESMLKMMRRLIGEDIDLVWQPSAHLWPVKMDPTQLDQILANLCVNARDAIEGVGKITIETGKKTFDAAYCKDHSGFIPGDFVQFSVSDNGCGMDRDVLDNLFEPFFTTKEVGKETGLGLATIYGIVKQNNGFINVYSEPGQGSTFRIYLPRLIEEKEAFTPVPGKKVAAGGTETILLVEDEPTILDMTQKMLERKGYSVLPAATPAEAMDLARTHTDPIHLLMTDVVMPEMNGRDLAEQMSSLYPDIKLLFMSGYPADVIAHQGMLDDGVAFIQKPFSMKDLAEKLREVLDE
jgi:two-component system, cell cycle sensor histidine kinase and response regulator CckA